MGKNSSKASNEGIYETDTIFYLSPLQFASTADVVYVHYYLF